MAVAGRKGRRWLCYFLFCLPSARSIGCLGGKKELRVALTNVGDGAGAGVVTCCPGVVKGSGKRIYSIQILWLWLQVMHPSKTLILLSDKHSDGDPTLTVPKGNKQATINGKM